MNSSELSQLLKINKPALSERSLVRIHRAISWMKCAEEYEQELDLKYIALWIAFNSCYAINSITKNSEREKLRAFINKLIKCDTEKRIYNILWNKFSGPIRLLIENEFVYQLFWEAQSNSSINWESIFKKSIIQANNYLSHEKVPELLEIVLERLYTLRNQIMHGGATFRSSVNRSQVKDGSNILSFLIPIIIEIMICNDDDWGEIHYPNIGHNK